VLLTIRRKPRRRRLLPQPMKSARGVILQTLAGKPIIAMLLLAAQTKSPKAYPRRSEGETLVAFDVLTPQRQATFASTT
jgi:hypothetical protein